MNWKHKHFFNIICFLFCIIHSKLCSFSKNLCDLMCELSCLLHELLLLRGREQWVFAVVFVLLLLLLLLLLRARMFCSGVHSPCWQVTGHLPTCPSAHLPNCLLQSSLLFLPHQTATTGFWCPKNMQIPFFIHHFLSYQITMYLIENSINFSN